MTNEEVERHAEHLCDVWPVDPEDDHIGVIGRLAWLPEINENMVLVEGHPEYGPRWFYASDLSTMCKIKD